MNTDSILKIVGMTAACLFLAYEAYCIFGNPKKKGDSSGGNGGGCGGGGCSGGCGGGGGCGG